MEGQGPFTGYRTEIMSAAMACAPADLKDVNEIGIECDLHHNVHRRKIEIFEGEAVEQHSASQQLLPAHMNSILREVEGLAKGDVAGGELDLRMKGLLRARRQHYGTMSEDLEFELAEKPCIVVEKTDIWGASRGDVASNRGGEEGLAVDESEIINLARLKVLIGDPWLYVRTRNLDQFIFGYAQQGIHATARCCGNSSSELSSAVEAS